MYLLGYDIGSSAIKATLLEAESGRVVATALSPEKEMEIIAINPGWAEQHPQLWWENVRIVTKQILSNTRIAPGDIYAIEQLPDAKLVGSCGPLLENDLRDLNSYNYSNEHNGWIQRNRKKLILWFP